MRLQLGSEQLPRLMSRSCMAVPNFQTCALLILLIALPAGLVIPTASR